MTELDRDKEPAAPGTDAPTLLRWDLPLFILIGLTATGCIALSRLPELLASIWFPNAMMVAFLYLRPGYGRVRGLVVFAAAIVAANLLQRFDLPAAAALTAANTLEVAVATVLLDRLLPQRDADLSPVQLLQALLAGAVVAPLAGVTAAAGLLAVISSAPPETVAAVWWVGSLLGATAVLPLALTGSRAAIAALARPGALAGLAAIVALVLGATLLSLTWLRFPFVVMALPLMYAALRTSAFETALAAAAMILTVLAHAFLSAKGPQPADIILNTELSTALSTLPPLLFAALKTLLADRERQARESETMFRQTMANSAIGVAIVGLDGNWQTVNESVCTFLGYSREELLVMTFQDITWPEDLDKDMSQLRRTLAGEIDTYQVEKRYVRKDGRVVWALLAVSLVRQEGTRRPRFFISQIADIDGAKRAALTIAEAESRWNFALESARQGVWDYDVAAGRTYYSPTWKAQIGLSPDDTLNDPTLWLQLIHPDDRAAVQALDSACLEGRQDTFEAEFRIRHRDGRWIWIADRGRVIARDRTGRALRMIGTHTDITPLKEAQEALRVLNKRTQLAVEAGEVGIWEYDIASGRLIWDARMCALYGMKENEFDGERTTWRAMLAPEDRPQALAALESTIATGVRLDTEVHIRRRDGQARIMRTLARLVRDDEGQPRRVIGTHWDTTEQHRLTNALFEEKERLRITLHSIGDAVITTDENRRVTFLNPIAEHLTGWTSREAEGRLLTEIFRLVDETTGTPIPDPVEQCLLSARPYYLQDDAVLLHRDGGRCNIQDSAAPVRKPDGEILGAVLVFQDITETRVLQRQLLHAATHDALTALPNRAAFERTLGQLCEDARQTGRHHALAFVDLDRFKIVNDTAGHAAGDALLKDVARILKAAIRPSDVVARLGGDEFALLLRDCDLTEAEAIATRALEAIRLFTFRWRGRAFDVGVSIGVTDIAPDTRDPAEVMMEADVACYTAKSAGRDQLALYSSEAGDARRHRGDIDLVADLRTAIEGNRLQLYAQQIVDIGGGGHELCEILVRMADADGAPVSPGRFIPAAERYNLMGRIDRWVVRTVLNDYRRALQARPGLSVSINISGNSLDDPTFWPFVNDQIALSGIAPARLHFEITETAFINNFAAATAFASGAQQAGARIALDDFGVGQSSLTYLKQFHPDYVKIDGSFIANICTDETDRAIVAAIASLSRLLNVTTVAEWVEDEATLATVRSLGIDRAQGYLFGRPKPLAEILAGTDAVQA
ncbi:PAS domain S-box protein [Pseudoxanthobacter sp.]|uniref:PAS domain S-box protein n=1 Tax=Pseudoxanthobacter sp. TaxID=1925742 RepID=UPI002FE0C183